MEILSQITVLVSNPPQGSGNLGRLRKRFEKATASTHGFMDFKAFSKAIRYPLKLEVQRKIFRSHFHGGERRGLDYERFLSILMRLDHRTREDRIEDILNFYKDDDGQVSFDDFKNIIAVALQQIDFQIGEVELHRLVETILKLKQPRYEVDCIRRIIQQWNSLDKRIGDILYLALFLEPKVPLDTAKHHNRFPRLFRPRSSASRVFLLSALLAYLSAGAALAVTVWAYTCTSTAEGYGNSRLYDGLKSIVASLNGTYTVPPAVLAGEGGGLEDLLRPEDVVWLACRNVATELLNFNLLVVALLTLRSMKVALCRHPLCGYLNREDLRLGLWLVAFSLCALCVAEYVLVFACGSCGEQLLYGLASRPNALLLNSRGLHQAASALKVLVIGATLLIRVPAVRNRLVHFTLDVSELNLNVFIAIHLLQEESFLKWCVPLLVACVVDSHLFARASESVRSLDANFCMTSGGLIVSTARDGLDFLLGDIFLLAVDQVAVSSTVPAWAISLPSDKSQLRLLLHEGHWQTKVLRQLLKNIGRGWSRDEEGTRPEGSLRNRRNVVILSSSSDPAPHVRWPHATTVQASTSLQARIIGPFRSVHFELYARYSALMLLTTPKSAGAVLAFLRQHSEAAGLRQKVVLVFAAPEFRRVEWFIASLIQLELWESARHATHREPNRSLCDQCRLFFRMYLTSATSGQDARILWVQLAMGVLAGEKSHLIHHLQESLYPDLNVLALNKQMFEGIQFVLCDADFPYADAFFKLSKQADKEIRHF